MAARDDTTNPFNPDDPSEEFCLLGKGISRVEFDKEINSLGWMNLPGYLIAALKRGVGVHHAGLARRYRVLVENFFRRGKSLHFNSAECLDLYPSNSGILKVVISTETLALGVNAPAKTVIFGGDSHLLNALNFRQCSGRAGRRGFDTLGRVVFVGISIDRIQRLLLSKLPKLGGTFPLTTTLVLRLNSLLHGSNRAVSILPIHLISAALSSN
jgi:superfamily II RNA helicase